MDLSCHSTHPTSPSLLLRLPLPPADVKSNHSHQQICLSCNIALLRSAPATIRLSALMNISALPANIHLLQQHDQELPSILLNHLMSIIFSSNTKPDQFATKLCAFTQAISTAADAQRNGLAHRHHLLSCSIDAARSEQCNTHTSLLLLICLMSDGKLLENPHALTRIFTRERKEQLLHVITDFLISEKTLYVELIPILRYLADYAICEGCPETVLQAIESALPPYQTDDSVALYMSLLKHLLNDVSHNQKVIEALFQSESLFSTMRYSLLSQHPDRAVTAAVISSLCHAGMASRLIQEDIMEHIIESLRSANAGKSFMEHPLQALVAISAAEPELVASKWCYCFGVIVETAELVQDRVSERLVITIFSHAFRHAPIPVFNSSSVKSYISFLHKLSAQATTAKSTPETGGIPVVSKASLLRDGLSSLVEFLQRYNVDLDTSESLLHLCDSLSHEDALADVVFSSLMRIVDAFKLTSAKARNKSEECVKYQVFGKQILHVVFDSWKVAFEECSERFTRNDQRKEILETLKCALELLTSVISPSFYALNCFTNEDLDQMQCWCWRLFPPRALFAFAEALSGSEENFKASLDGTMQDFLRHISVGFDSMDKFLTASVPCSDEEFLTALASAPWESQGSFCFALIQKAILLRFVDTLAEPNALAQALFTRLEIETATIGKREVDIISIGRAAAFLCSEFGITFLDDAPILEEIIRDASFCLENDSDFFVFQEIVCAVPCSTSVLAWDKFCNDYRQLGKVRGQRGEEIAKLILEGGKELGSALISESILFAISRSKSSDVISECVGGLFSSHGDRVHMFTALQKAGFTDVLYNVVQQLLSNKKEKHGLDRKEGLDINLECARISSLVSLIPDEGFVKAAPPSLRMVQGVCKLFIRECAMDGKHETQMKLILCASRFLVCVLDRTSELSSRKYVIECGVYGQAIKVFREYSRGKVASLHEMRMVSMMMCVVFLIVQEEDFRESGDVSKLVNDSEFWAGLLRFCPSDEVGIEACTAANACVLLDVMIQAACKIENGAVKVRVSDRNVALLCNAGSSLNEFLREAALVVLRRIMMLEVERFSAKRCCSLHLALSAKVAANWNESQESAIEGLYTQIAVQAGHVHEERITLSRQISSADLRFSFRSGRLCTVIQVAV